MGAMADSQVDTPLMKKMTQLRAKYRTKSPYRRRAVLCTQIVTHPMNRCGGVIRSVRARSLAANIIYDGYDPVEASVKNLFVEAVIDENGQVDRKFTEPYLAIAGKDEHNVIDPCPVAE